MSRAQMFCALTTVALGEASLRGLDAGDATACEHEPLDLDAFDDPDAAPPCRAREGAGDEIRVGESGLGLEADQGRVVEAADRQPLRRVLRREELHRDALRLLREQRGAQRRELRPVGRGDQVAALDEAGRRLVVVEVGGERIEDLPRTPRQLDVLGHRVVGAQDAARLRRRARADRDRGRGRRRRARRARRGGTRSTRRSRRRRSRSRRGSTSWPGRARWRATHSLILQDAARGRARGPAWLHLVFLGDWFRDLPERTPSNDFCTLQTGRLRNDLLAA